MNRRPIIVISPTRKPTRELTDEAVVALPLPDSAQLNEVLARLTQIPGVKVNLAAAGREKLGRAALGRTTSQARRTYAKAIVSDGALDDRHIDVVVREKKEIAHLREVRPHECGAVGGPCSILLPS